MLTVPCTRCATAARKCRTLWWRKAADTPLGTFRCRVHGVEFDFEGRRAGGGRSDLTRLALHTADNLVWVGPGAAHPPRWQDGNVPSARDAAAAATTSWSGRSRSRRTGNCSSSSGSRLCRPIRYRATADSIVWTSDPLEGGTSFSARCYRSLVKDSADEAVAAALRRAEPIAAMASRRTHGHAGDPRIARVLPLAAHLRRAHARGPEARAGHYLATRLTPLDAARDAHGRGVRAARGDGFRIPSRPGSRARADAGFAITSRPACRRSRSSDRRALLAEFTIIRQSAFRVCGISGERT
jgi:hypothetical protein